MSKAKTNVKFTIRENTADMDQEEYIAFLRELADDLTFEADLLESDLSGERGEEAV